MDCTKILLDQISEFGKTSAFKVNIQKLKVFSYTNNEISDTQVREKISFAISTREIRYLGINLT